MGGEEICVDEKLDDSGYSSPVPLIGLYITGATLVCLLFILVDAFAGFRYRKKWLPCRFFSLNSVTLTLLSIAVKLPLDLTSSIPRVQDQLSKLTGTTLICICMGVFMPSLGTYREFECFNNMAALTIFVVTIVVNVCIQMHTGVIILFRTEHIIILRCMMILLVTLWYYASEIHCQNEITHDGIKDIVVKGKGSMLQRLKVSYLCGFNSNPQLRLFRRPLSILVATLCVLSLVVLLKATFQYLVSKKSNICGGVSVCKWSMTSIVVSQIVTVIVGGLAIIFRLFTMIGHLIGEFGILQEGVEGAEAIMAHNPIFQRTNFFLFKFYLRKTIEVFIIVFSLLPSLPIAFLDGSISSIKNGGTCCCWRDTNGGNEELMQEFNDLIHEGEMRLDKSTLRKGVNDMKQWIEKSVASNQLTKILSMTPPLHQDDSPFLRLKTYYDSRKSGYQVSSLSVVLLVRIATISLPSSLSGSLLSSLNEVFEVLQFVGRKMSTSSFENEKKYVLAEALLVSSNFNILLPAIIKGLKEVMQSDYVQHELAMMTDFIQLQAYESVDELYGFMEQLFVDMLDEFLVQLPNAIFREIIESNAEDCEKTVKFALKILCKVEPLESLVQWSFPVGTSIVEFSCV